MSEAVEVRRSARRRRTVSVARRDGKVIVMIPASFTKAQEAEWVAKMLAKLGKPRPSRRSDVDLTQRAGQLSRRYLGGKAMPTSVRWVTNQNSRWGSCTPMTGEIRLSHRLKEMPEYVVDSVLMHELAHLLQAGHGPAFWELADRYPKAERAKGYLEAAAHALGWEISPDDEEPPRPGQ